MICIIEEFNKEKSLFLKLDIQKLSDISEISEILERMDNISTEQLCSIYFLYKHSDIEYINNNNNDIKLIFKYNNINEHNIFKYPTQFIDNYEIIQPIICKLKEMYYFKQFYKEWLRELKIDSLL